MLYLHKLLNSQNFQYLNECHGRFQMELHITIISIIKPLIHNFWITLIHIPSK